MAGRYYDNAPFTVAVLKKVRLHVSVSNFPVVPADAQSDWLRRQ
jgi:hypothetical protein